MGERRGGAAGARGGPGAVTVAVGYSYSCRGRWSRSVDGPGGDLISPGPCHGPAHQPWARVLSPRDNPSTRVRAAPAAAPRVASPEPECRYLSWEEVGETGKQFMERRRWKKVQRMWHLGLTGTLCFVSGSVPYLQMCCPTSGGRYPVRNKPVLRAELRNWLLSCLRRDGCWRVTPQSWHTTPKKNDVFLPLQD